MKEIGSEYHYEKLKNNKNDAYREIPNVQDSAFVFSGRTAIETVLLNEPHVKKAMLPAYCCNSMMEPFRKADIECVFYEVNFKNGLNIHVDIPEDVDLLLWCNYFGFRIEMPDFSEFVRRGGTIVEDITHSFFSSKQCDNQSHYLVASLRKWGPLLCGGYCATREDTLCHKPGKEPATDFLLHKRHAMSLKKDYISGDEKVDKTVFLREFTECNKWLADNYSQLKMDEESKAIFENIDWRGLAEIRKRNARILYDGLKNISSIRFLFEEEDMDCTLFVPIIVENRKRDDLRKTLTENEIYCPIHWPKPNADCVSNLYELELSLVCDQRYNENDMKRIIEIISKWNDALQ